MKELQNLKIIPKKGYDKFLFGTDYNQIVSILGKPDEVIEDNDSKEFAESITAFFDNYGLAMFFENIDEGNSMTLQSIEIDDDNALMFNKNIFSLSKNELIKFLEEKLEEKSVVDDDKEFEDYDIIEFNNNGVSLLFEDDDLISIILYNV